MGSDGRRFALLLEVLRLRKMAEQPLKRNELPLQKDEFRAKAVADIFVGKPACPLELVPARREGPKHAVEHEDAQNGEVRTFALVLLQQVTRHGEQLYQARLAI